MTGIRYDDFNIDTISYKIAEARQQKNKFYRKFCLTLIGSSEMTGAEDWQHKQELVLQAEPIPFAHPLQHLGTKHTFCTRMPGLELTGGWGGMNPPSSSW